MSLRNIILIVVALLIAGITAFAMSAQMGAGEEQAVVEVQKMENRILVAKKDIPMGAFVRTMEDLEWKQFEPDKIKDGIHLREEDENIRTYEGAIVRRSYRAGEPIKVGTLIKPGSGGFLSAVLEPGMRAVSIAVDATTGNAGFIFPGDAVDVILVHAIEQRDPVTGEENQQIFSNTFIEKARVVAVDQSLDNPENKAMLAKTITIEVSPKQAEEVQVAREMGRISFALRSMSDYSGGEAVELTREDGAVEDDFISTLEEKSRLSQFTSSQEVSPALNSGLYNTNVKVLRGQATVDESFTSTQQPIQ